MAAFTDQIGNHPMIFSLLDIIDVQSRYLRPPKATTEQNSDHCVIAFAAQILAATRRKESLPLING